MKENKKSIRDKAINRPKKKNDPDKRFPNPDDPNEQKEMPNQEMPITSNPHNEELMDHIPK